MLKKVLLTIILLIALVPFSMWLLWVFQPNTRLVAAIVDKTVLTDDAQKHASLTWVLKNGAYTKTGTKSYSVDRDYYGFFPLKDEKFKIKGLERFSSSQIRQLSLDADMVYFTDTYGVYNEEWFLSGKGKNRYGMIYGGLSAKDIELLAMMKARKKLIIAEFNTIGSPTDSINRGRFEEIFAIRWTGWTGRFFSNLDTAVNKEIPTWIVGNYRKTHSNQWPFKRAGIIFVSDKGQVCVLEDATHLNSAMPHIKSNAYGQENLSLPDRIKYPLWFDIILPDSRVNKSAADFDLDVNKEGLEELQKYGIPAVFPAVTYHKEKDYTFYYFSGDFSDNPVSMKTAYFKGIELMKWMFPAGSDPAKSPSFFWNFYRPLLDNILDDYSSAKR